MTSFRVLEIPILFAYAEILSSLLLTATMSLRSQLPPPDFLRILLVLNLRVHSSLTSYSLGTTFLLNERSHWYRICIMNKGSRHRLSLWSVRTLWTSTTLRLAITFSFTLLHNRFLVLARFLKLKILGARHLEYLM